MGRYTAPVATGGGDPTIGGDGRGTASSLEVISALNGGMVFQTFRGSVSNCLFSGWTDSNNNSFYQVTENGPPVNGDVISSSAAQVAFLYGSSDGTGNGYTVYQTLDGGVTWGPPPNQSEFEAYITSNSAGVTGTSQTAPASGGLSITLPAGVYYFSSIIQSTTNSATSGCFVRLLSLTGDSVTTSYMSGTDNSTSNVQRCLSQIGGSPIDMIGIFLNAPNQNGVASASGRLVSVAGGTYTVTLAQMVNDAGNPLALVAGSYIKFHKK